jgi:hypothetical protein
MVCEASSSVVAPGGAYGEFVAEFLATEPPDGAEGGFLAQYN